jgi:hypothetical protein
LAPKRCLKSHETVQVFDELRLQLLNTEVSSQVTEFKIRLLSLDQITEFRSDYLVQDQVTEY